MAIEYIHKPSIGDEVQCEREIKQISPILKTWYRENKIIGYQGRIIKDASKRDADLIFSEDSGVTGGVFPYIFLAVEPSNLKCIRELEESINKRNYQEIGRMNLSIKN